MFSQHPKSKFWSEKNEKNPNEVALNSHKKFWFDCECGHQFYIALNNVNILNRWCPYCSNPSKKMCELGKIVLYVLINLLRLLIILKIGLIKM
jgi:hypothetical protein